MHKLDPIERLPDPSSTQKDFAAAKSAARASSLARSGRAKYCPACAKEVHRQQKAKSARKRRSGVDSLGAKSP